MRHGAPSKLPPPAKGRTAADVWTECFGHPCAHLPSPDFQALAHDGADVIGVANVYVRRMSGPAGSVLVGWMAACAVLPERQEKGIGTALVMERHDWLRAHNVLFAALHCEKDLVFHNQRLGYKKAPNVPGPGVAMVCELTDTEFPPTPFTYREPW